MPANPDIELPTGRREPATAHAPVIAVVAVGGALGALARYGVSLALPTPPGHFPWSTFAINVAGCALIGVLMVLVTEVWSAHRLLRPFLGVGVLGGFTTFSTYAVDLLGLLGPRTALVGLAYLAGTLVGALLATVVGIWVARLATRSVRRVGRP